MPENSKETMQEGASPAVMQQMGILNMRVNDMLTQLNTVIKALMDENASLGRENAELKAKPKETQKTK